MSWGIYRQVQIPIEKEVTKIDKDGDILQNIIY